MLLYGDTPPSGEPTLELYRRSVPVDGEAPEAARQMLTKVLERWGWDECVDAAAGCVSAVLHAIADAEPDAAELFAYRRAHQLTVELHFTGVHRFHQMLGHDPRLAMVDTLAPLWGVRPVADGEAVWFEFQLSSLQESSPWGRHAQGRWRW